MAWFVLFLAVLYEVSGACLRYRLPGRASRPVGLKYADGFSRIWPTRSLPLGTSYAVWTDVGMVGTALLGMLRFP
jgi:quaternary ammonium compound-resistance protein SugE